MTPNIQDNSMTASSQLYIDNQTKLISLIEQMRSFIKVIHKPGSDDRFILHYPQDHNIGKTNSSLASQNLPEFKNSKNLAKLFILGPSPDILQHCLDGTSMAKILSDKMNESLLHLDRLKQRVCDKTSKVLVTGDVNAGKSSFVNALLGADVLPTDQQPCTQSFCEVIPTLLTSKLTIPMVHAVSDLENYSQKNESSYHEMSVEEMQESIQDEEPEYTWYRLFWPMSSTENSEKRFTAGSALDVSLIDSPGLNSDLFKTTSLFSKQADIDAVVFVINAANHLTLSAREFLERASKEKDYIFVVVNKFDDIKNREKCKRIILQQISEVLPATSKESSELIHFVSVMNYMKGLEVSPFETMEECLKNFILENRTKSKLLPVLTYIRRLTNDLEEIFEENVVRIKSDYDKVSVELEMISPCYEELLARDLPFRNSIQNVINSFSTKTHEACTRELLTDLSNVGSNVKWQGLLGVWNFRHLVIHSFKNDLNKKIEDIRKKSIAISLNGIHELNAIACTHAHQVFSSPSDLCQISEQQVSIKFESIQNFNWDIPDLAPWDLIDIGEELTSTKTWIGASALGAAFFGYRPLVSLGFNTFDMIVRGRSKSLLFLGLVGGAVAIGLAIADLESMIRRRLTLHIKDYISGGQNLTSSIVARRMENFTRELLMDSSMSLIGRFEEAIGTQRRLRAEKDMEKRQCESVLVHFNRHRDTLRSIRLQIEGVEF